MFHNIPAELQARMQYLEAIDAQDRVDGTPQSERLRQIPPETGRFIAMMAAAAPKGQVLEIGTSAGYSSMWLALACRQRGDQLVTFEMLKPKEKRARETFAAGGVESEITLIHGDALHYIPDYPRVAFCFLDAEKEVYQDCYDLLVPNLVAGGILIADNMISHKADLQPFLARAEADDRLDALLVPVGKGLLFCRKAKG